VIVATRSESMIQYPADRRLGLALSYDSVDQVAKDTRKYKQLCQEAGWEPTPDQIVYRTSILLAETDSLAVDRLASLGLGERGLNLRSSLTQAVLAAREGREFDLRHPQVLINGNQTARASRQPITFVGGPDTIIKGLKEFHEQCGLGVVDLGFQHSGTKHAEVMNGIELFGREVLPEIKQF